MFHVIHLFNYRLSLFVVVHEQDALVQLKHQPQFFTVALVRSTMNLANLDILRNTFQN